MKLSTTFTKPIKSPPKDAQAINHKLLVQAGFIDQLMSGSWTLLPLGWRVVSKVNQIIREEMNAIGSQEMLMPLLHPKSIWNETGRWDKANDIMYKLKDSRDKEFALSFTHEEIVLDLARKFITSYKDLPQAIYHFSTKFRNEPRAKSGILRGREFMMKDLYSLHATKKDLDKFYEKVKTAYLKIFNRIGFTNTNFRVIESGGGVFTHDNTHEFQVITDGGEDTIYYCDNCDWGINLELVTSQPPNICPVCKKGKVITAKATEVGNIFRFGTTYSEKMKAIFTDTKGENQFLWFGSYGIGSTRVMGAIVESSHDDKGIVWFPSISPFTVHLVSLPGGESDAEKLYQELVARGIEVLWDDRDESAGTKFSVADLIGIPIRLVVSQKTNDKIEFKKRTQSEFELVSTDELLNKLKQS